MPPYARRASWYAVALAGPALLAPALSRLVPADQDTNVAFGFLLLVLLVASLGGLGPGVLAAVASFLTFNVVFVEPVGSLTVSTRRDTGVLVGLLVVGVVVSVLAARLRRSRLDAERAAREARLLHEMTASLGDDVELGRRALEAERRRLELLEATDAQRGAVLSAVSHDLRTPLAAIKASAAALAAGDLAPEERAQLADSVVSQTDRLDRLVRNILALSRIEAGRLVVHRENVPVEELVGAVLSRLRPAIVGRRLEVTVPDNLPAVRIDPVQVEQVVGNLVENVLAHTPVNAGLIVRAVRRGGRVAVLVADEGPGVPPADRDRIFERFGRGGNAGPGSGLGLAIARAYAEANGGSLDLVDAGYGAAFELTLETVAP